MQITQFTDFSFRVLMYLSICEMERPNTAQMADKLGVSKHHLTKVVQELNRLGLIKSQRGANGGISLDQKTLDMSLSEVFLKMEQSLVLVECFNRGSNTCPLQPACALNGIFKEALDAFLGVLENYKISDLVKNRDSLSFYLD